MRQVRLARIYGDFRESYDFLDPDTDVGLPDPLSGLSDEQKEERRNK